MEGKQFGLSFSGAIMLSGNAVMERILVKRKLTILGMCIGILGLLCACTLRSDKRISEEKIDVRREVFEKYPEEKYPDECSGRWL